MHFPLAVITDEDTQYDELLERYYENLPAEKMLYMTREDAIDFGRNLLNKKATKEDCYQAVAQSFDKDMIDEEGNLYYMSNPNAKWDWYEVGGRWYNLIRMKNGVKVNSCMVKDIDTNEFGKTVNTFAVITPDGEWYECGKDKRDWNEKYYDTFIKDADPEHTITIVDCHI